MSAAGINPEIVGQLPLHQHPGVGPGPKQPLVQAERGAGGAAFDIVGAKSDDLRFTGWHEWRLAAEGEFGKAR
jgi:hypothetical protein